MKNAYLGLISMWESVLAARDGGISSVIIKIRAYDFNVRGWQIR